MSGPDSPILKRTTMGFLDRLFGKSAPADPRPPEHAVIVEFAYGSTDLHPLHALESRLHEAIAAAGAGELDGDEIDVDGSDGSLYMYGPDADRLFEVVRPHLERVGFMHGAKVTLRYGAPVDGTEVRRLVIG